ncbi:MAG: 50S ribosomal protein L21 [Alphaproteobacteria bacterium]|jgi:large subunit ribosomal protein L21|nr:50S ribosomal protein L21 [Alphaproteobacteria bacterium]
MFAIVKTGGKQYRVEMNTVIKVEKLEGESGSTIQLDTVLMLFDGKKATIGEPTVAGALVEATVVAQARAPKIIVFKKKRRHNYRRKKGHRQPMTILRVSKIVAA